MIWNLWFSLLLLTGTAFAAVENIDTFNDGTTPVVNENFRTLNDNVNKANTNVQTLTAYFTGGILGAAYGGTGQDSSNWTSGDYVYMSSTGVWGHTPLIHGIQLFTSSGTFTAPTGVTKVYLTMVAGGGGGGGGQGGGGSGGGGGASCINYPFTVVAGNNYTVTVGAGGAAGTPTTNGGNGGTTSFDSVSLAGGAGGVKSLGNGGLGGLNAATPLPLFSVGATNATVSGTGASTFIPGGNGGKSNSTLGGGGGSTPFGNGASGVTNSDGGSATANTGAGGAGGASHGGGDEDGGAGASGIVIVIY